jgi:hypothetical protein
MIPALLLLPWGLSARSEVQAGTRAYIAFRISLSQSLCSFQSHHCIETYPLDLHAECNFLHIIQPLHAESEKLNEESGMKNLESKGK